LPGGFGGGGRTVVSYFPEHGDVEIPVKTAVEVSFNGAVHDLLFSPEFQFMVFPQPEEFGDLEISPDGRTISAEVELAEDRVYQLVVISRETGLYSVQFTTGEEISTASVSGQIRLPSELPRQAGFIPGESYALLLDEKPEGELAPDSEEFERSIVAVEAALNGRPLRDFRLEDGGRVLLFPVALQAGQFYKFSVFRAEGMEGSRLERPLEVVFSTGAEQVALGSVAGRVSLQTLAEDGEELKDDEADQIDEAAVFLFEEGQDEELVLVSAAEVDEEGRFLLDDILPGEYQVFAEINTASGQELKDVYDPDNDGLAEVVQVGGGARSPASTSSPRW